MLKILLSKLQLTLNLTERDIKLKYKGSYLGVLWSIITPLIMLTIYTFVFSSIFNAKWGSKSQGGQLEFALMIFCGISVYIFFSEALSRSCYTISNNINYVKKVVFPLETLPISTTLSTGFNLLISLVLLSISSTLSQVPSITLISIPMIIAPLLIITIGFSLFLSSFCVYFKDTNQTIALILSGLQFLSPVFYPTEAVPEKFQHLLYFSPITIPIEQLRLVILNNKWPNWETLFIYYITSIVVFVIGLQFFKKLKNGFPDAV